MREERRTSERPEHGEGRGGRMAEDNEGGFQSHPKELSLAPSTVRNQESVNRLKCEARPRLR